MTAAASRVCAALDCPQLLPCPDHSRPPRNGSTRAWRKRRAQVLARDHHTCQVCGAPATEADHITPRNEGGSDDLTNLRATCLRCNRTRVG